MTWLRGILVYYVLFLVFLLYLIAVLDQDYWSILGVVAFPFLPIIAVGTLIIGTDTSYVLSSHTTNPVTALSSIGILFVTLAIPYFSVAIFYIKNPRDDVPVGYRIFQFIIARSAVSQLRAYKFDPLRKRPVNHAVIVTSRSWRKKS